MAERINVVKVAQALSDATVHESPDGYEPGTGDLLFPVWETTNKARVLQGPLARVFKLLRSAISDPDAGLPEYVTPEVVDNAYDLLCPPSQPAVKKEQTIFKKAWL